MKVFIGADIEGVAGITAKDEARKGQPGDAAFRAQMDAVYRDANAAYVRSFYPGADLVDDTVGFAADDYFALIFLVGV